MSFGDYVKPKYVHKAKVCYMDTDSFIVYIKTDDICKDIAEDVETRFDNSNYELDRPLPKGKICNWINKRWIRWKNNDKICWTKSKQGWLLKLKNHKTCLETPQLDKKIKCLAKTKINVDQIKENHKN